MRSDDLLEAPHGGTTSTKHFRGNSHTLERISQTWSSMRLTYVPTRLSMFVTISALSHIFDRETSDTCATVAAASEPFCVAHMSVQQTSMHQSVGDLANNCLRARMQLAFCELPHLSHPPALSVASESPKDSTMSFAVLRQKLDAQRHSCPQK
jgi:hypothetical protein